MNLFAADKPFISVLIATRNRAELLGKTLQSLQGQLDCGFAFEVVVVDNGSTDDTRGVLKDFSTKLPLVRLFEPEPGKNRALNRALAAARGDLLLFTDDDVAFSPGWLRGYGETALARPKFSIFCGPVVPVFPDGTPEWLKDHPITSPAYARFPPVVFPPLSESGPFSYPVLPFGPNFAVRRPAVGDMLFNPDFGPRGTNYPMGGETEFLKRLSLRRETIFFIFEASVSHHVEPRQTQLEWLRHRFFSYGRGQTRLNLVHGKQRSHQPSDFIKLKIFLFRMLKSISILGSEKLAFQCELKLSFLRGKLFEIETFGKTDGASDRSPESSG